MKKDHDTAQLERRPVEVKQRVLIRSIVDRLEPEEKVELTRFLEELNELRLSSLNPVRKLKAVLADVQLRRTAVFVLDRAATELKDLAWDDRTWTARLGLTAAAVAAIPTAGQGAGIAALGTAIGVPLWVVFGAGGAFAGALIEELKQSLPDGDPLSADSAPGTALIHIREAEYELLGAQIEEAGQQLVHAVESAGDADHLGPTRLGRVRTAFQRRRAALESRLRSRFGRG